VSSPSLFLIGPRGAGKSAVAALAAARLAVPCVDVDRQIERRAGLSVAQIFASLGEPAFRAREREVMLELLGPSVLPALVATGGGCVMDCEVRAGLRRQPGVLWLRAAAATLRARIAGSDRPSLTGADPVDELPRIVALRQPHYEDLARRTLDTTTLTIEEAADVVQQLWSELAGHHLR